MEVPMKSLWLKTGAIASTALWSFAAMAATTSSSSTVAASADPTIATKSTAEAKVASPTAKPLPLTVNALETFYGPGLTDMSKGSSSDDSIDSVTPMVLRSQIGIGYKVSDKMTITPVLDFHHVLNRIEKGPAGGFYMRDAFVKVSRSSLLEADIMGSKFTLDGDARAYAPTSKGSRDNNKIGALRASLAPSLQLGKSRFSLSAVIFGKFHVQSRQGTVATGAGMDQIEAYMGPQLNYEISDKVTAFVLYEADLKWNTFGVPNYAAYANSPCDVEPGVAVNVSDRLTLIPGLNWYTNQRLSTTSVMLQAMIKML